MNPICCSCGEEMGAIITRHGFTHKELARSQQEIREYHEGKRQPIGYRCVNPNCKNKQEVSAK